MDTNNTLLSLEHLKIIAAIRAGSGVLCVLFGSLAIIINVAFKKYRFHLQLMILYMSVTSVLYGAAVAVNRVDYFTSNNATRTFCAADAFLSNYSSWTVLLSVFAVSCNVFMEIIGRTKSGRCAQAFWLTLIFVSPLTINWIPFLRMEYGQAARWPWCSLPVNPSSDFGYAVKFVLTIGAYFLFILVQIVLYLAGVIIVMRRRKLREATNDPREDLLKRRQEKEVFTLVTHFVLVFVGYVFGFIAGVVSLNEGNSSVNHLGLFAVLIMYAAFNPLSVGLTAILITADRKLCNVKSLLSLFRYKRSIRSYPITRVIEESVISNPI